MQGRGFRDLASEYAAAGATVLGISFDTVEAQRKFAEDEGFPYALLSDCDGTIGEAYDAKRVPGEKYFEAGIPRRISYLIDPDGRIRRAWDVEGDGLDLDEHARVVLDEIRAAR